MKIFPAEQMGYFDAIQAYFLELTGRGAVLSGRDVRLLVDWRDRGADVAQICKGLEQAVRELHQPPRDIFACRYYVEDEVPKPAAIPKAEPVVITDDDDLKTETLSRIEAAGKKADREAFKEAYRDCWRRVSELNAAEDIIPELLDIEDLLLDAYWAGLKLAEQRKVLEQIQTEIESFRSMSDAARAQHELARRRKLLQEHYELLPLLDL